MILVITDLLYLCRLRASFFIIMPEITGTTNDLSEKQDVGKLLRSYVVPAMLNMVVMALYNIVDRIFIGQGAGAMAICGLALTLPFVSLMTTIGTLTGVGVASRVSSALTLRNIPLACKALGNALLLNIVLTVLLILLALFHLDTILLAFGGSEQTIPYAHKYLSIIIPGSLLTNLNFTCCNAFRAAGFSHKSMMIILTGVVVNILLDPILIFGFQLGIEGAAIATVISMAVSSVLILKHFHSPANRLRLGISDFSPHILLLASIVSIGMAAFVMNITTSMVNIIMNRYLVNYGSDYAIGAYGIISCYTVLIATLMMGICQGMQTIVSYNFATGNFQRTRRTLELSVRTGTLIVCSGFIIGELFAPWLVGIFTSNEILIALSTGGLRLTFLMMPVIGYQIIATSFFQSINKAPQAIVMNISRQFVFLIPALGIFSRLWGLTGIWLAIPFADLMATVVTTLFLFREKWLKTAAR